MIAFQVFFPIKKLKKFKYIYLEAFEYAFAFVFKDVALINCCDQYKVIYKIFFLTIFLTVMIDQNGHD